MSGRTLINGMLAQTRTELVLTLRRGESILVTLIIPVALFVFFASAHILPGPGRSVPFLLTGTVSLAIISTGLVSLGIATAYERYFGVLKWLGATPFPRAGLIAAKLMMVIVLEAVQVGILVLIAVAAFGWRPSGAPLLAVAAMLLGTVCFAGMGLAMAGALRAEATLAAANGLFLFFLLLGGLFVPLDRLPPGLSSVARVLPAAALADVLRGALRTSWSIPVSSLLILLLWSIATPLLATRAFRWE